MGDDGAAEATTRLICTGTTEEHESGATRDAHLRGDIVFGPEGCSVELVGESGETAHLEVSADDGFAADLARVVGLDGWGRSAGAVAALLSTLTFG